MIVSTTGTKPFLPASMPGRIALCFLLLLPVAYGVLALWFGQDANWDLENYHWYNAYAFLNGRASLDLLVAQTPTFYNPLLDVPFFIAATHLPARIVGFLLGALQGLNGILLYFLAYAALRRPPVERVALAIATTMLGMVGGGALGELGTTFWDNVISLGLFAGLLVLIPYAKRPGRNVIWAGVAGLLVGSAAALKQPQILYCAGIGLAVFTLPGSWKRRLFLAICFGSGGLIGILLTSGYWMFHLANAYGNPLFPYFNHIFHSPFADIDHDFRDTRFIPLSLLTRILFPVYFTLNPFLVGEPLQRGTAVLALFVLLPATLLAIAIRYFGGARTTNHEGEIADRAAARFLIATIAFSYLAWLQMFSIYRYAVPLEMLAPLGLLVTAEYLPGSPKLREAGLGVLFVLCAVTGVRGDWHRVAWHHHYVEMSLPPYPADTMVLMAGFNPTGFVATGFPPKFPVVRIQGNFMPPYTPPTQFSQIAKARVAAHHGSFVVVFVTVERTQADQALADYGLVVRLGSCRNIPNSLEDGKITICEVKRQDVE